MPALELYRNDGGQMGEGDSQLEAVPPGMTILFADTGQQRLYSFFNARIGKRMQGTAVYEYEDGDTALASLVEQLRAGVQSQDGTLKQGTRTEMSDPHRAVLALDNDPYPLDHARGLSYFFNQRQSSPDRPTEAESYTTHDESGESPGTSSILSSILRSPSEKTTLDYGAANYALAARLFKRLFNELSDKDVTMAVSKSGRTEQFADVDIVIDVDAEYVDVEPIDGTDEVLSDVIAEHRRAQFRSQIEEPLEELYTTYRELRRKDRSLARSVFAEMFRDRFVPYSLTLQSPTKLLGNYVGIIILSLLVGIAAGSRYAVLVEAAWSQSLSGLQAGGQALVAAMSSLSPLMLVATSACIAALPVVFTIRKRSRSSETGYNSLERELYRRATTVLILSLLGTLGYLFIQQI